MQAIEAIYAANPVCQGGRRDALHKSGGAWARTGPCYPATLILAADHDDRVVPSHAYKFTAALQAAQACGRPIVLRLARDASHSYASADTAIAERADMWSFIAEQLDMRIER